MNDQSVQRVDVDRRLRDANTTIRSLVAETKVLRTALNAALLDRDAVAAERELWITRALSAEALAGLTGESP